MSYNSKKTIVSMAAGILWIMAYIIYALGANSPAPEDLKSWAAAMLIFIGIGIVAIIVIQILFHIVFAIGVAVKEQAHDDKTVERLIASSMVEDERDRLINMKSYHTVYICAAIGLIASLVALAFGISTLFALHILLGFFAFSSIVEGVVSVILYEKGVHNG